MIAAVERAWGRALLCQLMCYRRCRSVYANDVIRCTGTDFTLSLSVNRGFGARGWPAGIVRVNSPSRTTGAPGLTWGAVHPGAQPEDMGKQQAVGTSTYPQVLTWPDKTKRKRSDGRVSATVVWRFGGVCGMAPISQLRSASAATADDFVFTTRTGLPLHNGDFYSHLESITNDHRTYGDPLATNRSRGSSTLPDRRHLSFEGRR